MRSQFLLAALVTLVTCDWSAAAVADPERSLSVAREVERLVGQRTLWPGFDPLAIPLAVYDGERTYLFRHPTPPEGFAPAAGARPEAHSFEGRHPAVTANSSAQMGEAVAATLFVGGASASKFPTDLAATAIHEAFHVFQRAHHATWSGNEGDVFLYPADDARLLGLRRLESAALRRALDAPDPKSAACWARLALSFRDERFAGMDSAFSIYERRTELNEGLATYVQLLAAGKATVEIPSAEFRPAEVRARTYATGPALGLLLDRFRPGWQTALEADDNQYLNPMLRSAIEGAPAGPAGPCAFAADEIAEIDRAAKTDAAAVAAARGQRRKTFDGRDGWRVAVRAAEGQPLWPQGFDPLNTDRVEGGLLHSRFLRLGNDAGELQAIDEPGADLEALTEGAGRHPLFNGVRRVTVAGLAKPEIATDGPKVTVRAPGFRAEFKNAKPRVQGSEVLVDLESAR